MDIAKNSTTNKNKAVIVQYQARLNDGNYGGVPLNTSGNKTLAYNFILVLSRRS